jgi:hypothetical protein
MKGNCEEISGSKLTTNGNARMTKRKRKKQNDQHEIDRKEIK